MQCYEIEFYLSDYLERNLSSSEFSAVHSHVEACESCSSLVKEMRTGLSLCRSFPEFEPPPGIIERILIQTSGRYRTLSWREYLLELFRPLYATPRFAAGFCAAAVSFFLVMNAFGVSLRNVHWTDLTPSGVLANVTSSVNLAYDSGLRRLSDLKVLYDIQSKIDELRSQVPSIQQDESNDQESKPSSKPEQNSSLKNLQASHHCGSGPGCAVQAYLNS